MFLTLALFAAALAEDLQVSSNVRGLSIVVNGEDTGLKTPATVSGLSPGSTVVQVGDNCRAGSSVVTVASGAENKVNVRAEEQLATLTVGVKPAQAVVDVNGGKVTLSPNVPVGLPCGTYEVTASLKGYNSASYTLELIGGQELELPIELERLGVSTVEMSVTPRTATLLFDGVEVGQDAAALPTVFEGLHTLGAKAKGYNDLEAPIWVAGGNNLVFRMELGRGSARGEVIAVGGAGKSALQKGAEEAVPEDRSDSVPNTEVIEVTDEPEEEGDDEEPDQDLAPVKSWSERAAEAAARDAEKPRASEKAEVLDEPGENKNPKAGLRVGGGVLLGVGAVVTGGGGYYTYVQAKHAHTIWRAKDEAAKSASGDQAAKLRAAADAYWVDVFAPRGNLMYGVFAGGGVLMGTGLLLLIVDAPASPFVAPAPGGGMIGWSGSF
jgi:acetyltransferase-like isoleucine patch superfamily enzyme